MDGSNPDLAKQSELEAMTLADLHALAEKHSIERYRRMRKKDLVKSILKAQEEESPRDKVEGAGPRVEEGPYAFEAGEGVEVSEKGDAATDRDVEAESAESRKEEEKAQAEEPEETPDRVAAGEAEEAPKELVDVADIGVEPTLAPVPEEGETRSGILDVRAEGFGLLRVEGFFRSRHDVYISQSQIRRLELRPGDEVSGPTRPQRRAERHSAIVHVDNVNGRSAEETAWLRERPRFDELVPVDPYRRLKLEHNPLDLTSRVVDLLAPVAEGQRILVSSPPRAGATTALQSVAKAVTEAERQHTVFVVLIEPRPEEATEWRTVVDGAETVSCAADMSPRSVTATVSLVIKRAQRLAELGEDVMVVLDSFTSLAGIRTLAEAAPGRDANEMALRAIRALKHLFCAARAVKGAGGDPGSLTIVGSEVAAGSSDFDVVLVEELARVANSQIWLDGEVAAQGVFPAVELLRTATRNRHIFLSQAELSARDKLRQQLEQKDERIDQVRDLLERLRSNISNTELLAAL